jgi:hypothetical protein
MYDMSSVAGLIASGAFQPDISEHADIITSSTSKTMHAPDHGMILFNDQKYESRVLDAVMPLLTSNTHPQEMAALGVALSEIAEFGPKYADQTVRNAKALAAALHERGLKVLYADEGYTQSHQFLVEFPDPKLAVSHLGRAGILCTSCPLPWDLPKQKSGLRIGTQVVTRRGMKESDMEALAKAIAEVLVDHKDPSAVYHSGVQEIALRNEKAAFSYDFHFPLEEDWYTGAYSRFKPGNPKEMIASLLPFSKATMEEIESLVMQMDLLHVEKEQFLFQAGDPTDSVYFIIEGECDVVVRQEEIEKIIVTLTERTHFGELGVMTNKPRALAVRAKAGTRLLVMKDLDFLAMLEKMPHAKEYFEQYLRSLPAVKGE